MPFQGHPIILKTFLSAAVKKMKKNHHPWYNNKFRTNTYKQMKKKIKKAQHLHCPHRKPLAYSQTLYKHTGHTLKIFLKSSHMANKMEKIEGKIKEL